MDLRVTYYSNVLVLLRRTYCVQVCDCNAQKHTATHYNTLQHQATHWNNLHVPRVGLLLQHTATRCNTVHHTTTNCNTLQHSTTHCIYQAQVRVCSCMRIRVFVFEMKCAGLYTLVYVYTCVRVCSLCVLVSVSRCIECV